MVAKALVSDLLDRIESGQVYVPTSLTHLARMTNGPESTLLGSAGPTNYSQELLLLLVAAASTHGTHQGPLAGLEAAHLSTVLTELTNRFATPVHPMAFSEVMDTLWDLTPHLDRPAFRRALGDLMLTHLLDPRTRPAVTRFLLRWLLVPVPIDGSTPAKKTCECRVHELLVVLPDGLACLQKAVHLIRNKYGYLDLVIYRTVQQMDRVLRALPADPVATPTKTNADNDVERAITILQGSQQQTARPATAAAEYVELLVRQLANTDRGRVLGHLLALHTAEYPYVLEVVRDYVTVMCPPSLTKSPELATTLRLPTTTHSLLFQVVSTEMVETCHRLLLRHLAVLWPGRHRSPTANPLALVLRQAIAGHTTRLAALLPSHSDPGDLMRALRDYLAVPVPRYQLRTVLGLALLFIKDGQMARPVGSGEATVHLATAVFRHLTGFIVDLTEDEQPSRAPIVDHGLLVTTLFVLSAMMSEAHPKDTDESGTSFMDVDPPYPVYLHGWVQIGEILRDVGWSPLAPRPATLPVSSVPVEEVGGEQAVDLERPEHAPRAIRLLWSQGLAQLLQVLPRPFLTSHLDFLETWQVRSEPIFKGDDTEWPFHFLASRLWRLSIDESTSSA